MINDGHDRENFLMALDSVIYDQNDSIAIFDGFQTKEYRLTLDQLERIVPELLNACYEIEPDIAKEEFRNLNREKNYKLLISNILKNNDKSISTFNRLVVFILTIHKRYLGCSDKDIDLFINKNIMCQTEFCLLLEDDINYDDLEI